VAASIAARPFLAGVDGDWITRQRSATRDVRVRALECLAAVALANGEPPLAGGGNRAEALRAYAQCQKLLADELVAPAPETEAIVKSLRA
jgi:hypothetical protein